MWAKKTYYKTKYLLGRVPVIPSVEFGFWSRRAENTMNWRRVSLEEPPEPELMNCVCEIAEYLYISSQAAINSVKNGTAGLKSEHNASYSWTAEDIKTDAEQKREIGNIIIKYLANTKYHNQFIFRGAVM